MAYTIQIVKLIVDNSNEAKPNNVISIIAAISKEIEPGTFASSHFKFALPLENDHWISFDQLTEEVILSWIKSPALAEQLAEAYALCDSISTELTVSKNIRDIDPPWINIPSNIGSSTAVTPGDINATQQPVSLEDLKLSKIQQIESLRYNKEINGVVIDAYIFDTNRESVSAFANALTILKLGVIETLNWKTATGVWVTLTLPEAERIFSLINLYIQGVFTSEKELTNLVLAAQSIEELEAIKLL